MIIKHVYVGGWFQRTRLHLSEIYDFLRGDTSPLPLDHTKLAQLRDTLSITNVSLQADVLEYVLLEGNNIRVKLYEDGLILLTTGHSHDLQADITLLTTYYEEKLSPALSYLFSLGAPVPKELANIKTVYPYFITTTDASPERITDIFTEFEQEQYATSQHEQVRVYRGDKLYIIDQHGVSDQATERFIEEKIFLREFKGQLHRYLNLHRTIWERIAEVKERGTLRGSDIPAFKTKVDQYKKTIDFIDTRINQMGTYLKTRESIVRNTPELSPFASLLGYKHETLRDNLSYIKDIWRLTQKYVDSASKMFGDLQAQTTSSSVKNLTVVTSMGVGASLLGLFTTSSVPEFTLFGVGYFFALAALGYTVNRLMQWWAKRKRYSISDTQLAKDL